MNSTRPHRPARPPARDRLARRGPDASRPSPAQAMPVFDRANYAQNLLTAARTLQQINKQIQSLQNEAHDAAATCERNLTPIDFPQLQQLTAASQADRRS